MHKPEPCRPKSNSKLSEPIATRVLQIQVSQSRVPTRPCSKSSSPSSPAVENCRSVVQIQVVQPYLWEFLNFEWKFYPNISSRVPPIFSALVSHIKAPLLLQLGGWEKNKVWMERGWRIYFIHISKNSYIEKNLEYKVFNVKPTWIQ